MITLDSLVSKQNLRFKMEATLKDGKKKTFQARQNGEIKTWKRTPGKFLIPAKHGLYDCFYIANWNGTFQGREVVNNAEEWELL